MGEAGNQLAGLQRSSRTGPGERYKSTGMGMPCYLAQGSKSRSPPNCRASLGGPERAPEATRRPRTLCGWRDLAGVGNATKTWGRQHFPIH